MKEQDIQWNDIIIVDEADFFVCRQEADAAPHYEAFLSLCRDEPASGDQLLGLYATTTGGVVMLHVE